LSLSLASRVISQEVRTQKDLILGVIKTATKKILGREQIVIRINPEDMQYVLQNKPKFKEEFKDIKQVSFKEDTSIGKGGCVIDTEYGSISAILDEEFDEMAKHLRRELEVSKEKEESGE
jgi:flagellar assembly protein FliH